MAHGRIPGGLFEFLWQPILIAQQGFVRSTQLLQFGRHLGASPNNFERPGDKLVQRLMLNKELAIRHKELLNHRFHRLHRLGKNRPPDLSRITRKLLGFLDLCPLCDLWLISPSG
jgi:hypothetical protein